MWAYQRRIYSMWCYRQLQLVGKYGTGMNCLVRANWPSKELQNTLHIYKSSLLLNGHAKSSSVAGILGTSQLKDCSHSLTLEQRGLQYLVHSYSVCVSLSGCLLQHLCHNVQRDNKRVLPKGSAVHWIDLKLSEFRKYCVRDLGRETL